MSDFQFLSIAWRRLTLRLLRAWQGWLTERIVRESRKPAAGDFWLNG